MERERKGDIERGGGYCKEPIREIFKIRVSEKDGWRQGKEESKTSRQRGVKYM